MMVYGGADPSQWQLCLISEGAAADDRSVPQLKACRFVTTVAHHRCFVYKAP